MRHVDLDLLRTFQAVVETGSFASAAEQLDCTQPAVSLQVKRLETLFGQTLVERARPARATEPGQTVLGYARRMLRLNDELLGRFDDVRQGVVLRVGIPNDFSVAMLPMALSRFAASEPGIILDLQSDLSTSLLEGLRTGQFDLVVAMTTERVSDLAVKTWSERLVWIAAPDMKPAADRPLPLICYPEGCVYRGRMLKRLAEEGINWRIAMTSSSFTSIIAAVQSGLGASTFAESTAPADLVVERRKPWPDLGTVSVGLYRHPDSGNGGGQRLADCLLESLDTAERKPRRRGD
ncbi:MAG TPA: LysR substrate-binding domain-containing protein [Dongiaceae bacterium]|nr:LysR substrate-binding domain-containing protein [Dongiaceae bacterium]